MPETYEEYLKRTTNWLERLSDKFTTLDERIDYVVTEQAKSAAQQVATLDGIERIKAAITQIPGGEVAMPTKIEQLLFAYNLAALQGILLTEKAPFFGYIKEVSIHWPPGCNALVDVRVGHAIRQFCPREGYLALDAVTPTYPFNEWVEKDEETWVEMKNTDGVNSHNITCTIVLEGVI